MSLRCLTADSRTCTRISSTTGLLRIIFTHVLTDSPEAQHLDRRHDVRRARWSHWSDFSVLLHQSSRSANDQARRGRAAKRVDRRLERLVRSQIFAPDASVRGARPCARTWPLTLSMPRICAGGRYHAWQRTPAHAPAFLRRLDHYASSSPMSSSGEHSTGQTKPELDTTLNTIVRVLALLICLKFQVTR